MTMKHAVIIGAGFAGLNAAKILSDRGDIRVTVIDKQNHHLFQPLLYQVATAGLSPAEIAVPVRSILKAGNIRVLLGTAEEILPDENAVRCDFGTVNYDFLICACGAKHSYFGHNEWEEHAPGLKTLEQATEIRRRILKSLEMAEISEDEKERRKLLTFAVIGGGPTGVELAGAIGEMSRYALSGEFKNIDPEEMRVILVEAGEEILSTFDKSLSGWTTQALKKLGVEVRKKSMVTNIDENGFNIGDERIDAATVIWAAGVQASGLGGRSGFETDKQGRIYVNADLTVPGYADIYAAGDQVHFAHGMAEPLPGIAPVALQQGKHIGANIVKRLEGKETEDFSYFDKGKMSTIGRSKAVVQVGKMRLKGFTAWVTWLFIHILYLTGFKNRFFVAAQWAWSYLTLKKGARLIINKKWRFYDKQ